MFLSCFFGSLRKVCRLKKGGFDSCCRLVLNCGTFRLIYDVGQEELFLALDEKAAKKHSSLEIGPTELFGFGSGDFAEGPEAGDIMSDVGGRWFAYKLLSEADFLIAESDKRLPDHVRSCDIFGKVGWS